MKCESGSTYFASIDECVPVSLSSLPAFVQSISSSRPCFGGIITTALQLEALRFCTVITSSLVIALSEELADYTALYDIATIQGGGCRIVFGAIH